MRPCCETLSHAIDHFLFLMFLNIYNAAVLFLTMCTSSEFSQCDLVPISSSRKLARFRQRHIRNHRAISHQFVDAFRVDADGVLGFAVMTEAPI
jgi:hypothetical protein